MNRRSRGLVVALRALLALVLILSSFAGTIARASCDTATLTPAQASDCAPAGAEGCCCGPEGGSCCAKPTEQAPEPTPLQAPTRDVRRDTDALSIAPAIAVTSFAPLARVRRELAVHAIAAPGLRLHLRLGELLE